MQGGFKLTGFPKTWEQLSPYSLVVLNDVEPRALGYHGRALLKTWVEQGGVLVVTGGPLALGKGLTRGTLRGEILPVSPTGPSQLIRGGRIVTPWSRAPGSPRYRGGANTAWLHQVELRPDALVVATANGHPAVVFRRHGAGKVTVLNLTTLDGDPVVALTGKTPAGPPGLPPSSNSSPPDNPASHPHAPLRCRF